MLLPPAGDDWVSMCSEVLPLGQLAEWPIVAHCGAVVVFAGTVRDYSEGRPGVQSLEYEAYPDGAHKVMLAVASSMRRQWPTIGRLALLHRSGVLTLTEVSVVVAVSAPHRQQAFDAATFAISTIKARVPIWKRETWQDGVSWGLQSHPVEGPEAAGPEDTGPYVAEVRKLRSVGA